MHIVAFCARKGGTGKSTLALQLAGDLATRGQQVVLADLDPQGSLQTWAAGRAAGLWPVVTQTDAAHLPALQQTLRARGTGWLLIDTPSVITHPAEAAIAGADLVLIPSQPAAMDMLSIHHTLLLTQAAGTPHTVVFNRVAARSKTFREIQQTVAQQAWVCPYHVGNRVAFQHSFAARRHVFEGSWDPKARSEISQLTTWMEAQL